MSGSMFYILGGGPSLDYFDWSSLDGRNTIGINAAWMRRPAGYHIVKDVRLIQMYGDRMPDGTYFVQRGQEAYPRMVPLRERAKWSDAIEDGVLVGDSTAVSAMNLAVMLGAKRIVMLGFDGGFHSGKSHWHSADGFYPDEWAQPEEKYAAHRREILALAGWIYQHRHVPVDLVDVSEPVYVTAYTPEYAIRAVTLGESLREFGISENRFESYAYESSGSWAKNCCVKPSIILRAMNEYWPRPVVWLDADARLCGKPDLFRSLYWEGADFAAHTRSSRRKCFDGELLSGTLWFANNARSHALCSAWGNRCALDPDAFDQRHLAAAITDDHDVRIERLPESYCAFDLVMLDHPETVPVIWHEQASRTLKAVVDHE